jgi:Fe-S-cluster-containing hydrogenase component 2
MAICPQKAIYRDEDLGRVMIDYNRCIGCRSCLLTCPFGAIEFDVEARKAIKCDLCDGDPLCAKLCPYGALEYVDAREQNLSKMTEVAQKLREIIRNR